MTKTALNQRLWPTLALLALTNLIPVFLVLYDHWTVSQMVLLFWLENIIIGVFNIVKLRTCQPQRRPLSKKHREAISFFAIHYGFFTLGHGVFVLVFFFLVEFDNGQIAGQYGLAETFGSGYFWWALLALLCSHAFSLYWHFFRGGERHRETVDSLFLKPYGRVVALHMTIILGAALVAWLGQPIWALLLLVLIKIMIDMAAHGLSHRQAQARAESSG